MALNGFKIYSPLCDPAADKKGHKKRTFLQALFYFFMC